MGLDPGGRHNLQPFLRAVWVTCVHMVSPMSLSLGHHSASQATARRYPGTMRFSSGSGPPWSRSKSFQ
jgi:hypothetical protein